MAGSLSHIVKKDGTFWMDLIENMGDAHEALEECFHVIRVMSFGDMGLVSAACDQLNYPDPFEDEYGEFGAEPMSDEGWTKYARATPTDEKQSDTPASGEEG